MLEDINKLIKELRCLLERLWLRFFLHIQGDTDSGCFLYQGMKQWHFCEVPANVNGAEYSQCQLRMFVVQYPQREGG